MSHFALEAEQGVSETGKASVDNELLLFSLNFSLVTCPYIDFFFLERNIKSIRLVVLSFLSRSSLKN